MECDNSVLGCGDGDVEKILIIGVLKGKCIDINFVFVVLVWVVNIFVCEIFGICLGVVLKMFVYFVIVFGSVKDGVVNVNGG